MAGIPLSRTLQCAASPGVALAIVAGALHVPHVNNTSVALVLIAAILGLSMRWGWAEGLVAALTGALGFDYFFLLPRGFGPSAPEDWVTLAVFLLTAITTGHLSARAARDRDESRRRADEIARLYQLGNALLDSGSVEAALERITEQIVEILGARGAALFNQPDGRIVRCGPEADRIPEERLREAAAAGNPFLDAASQVFVAPIRRNGSPAGGLGIAGVSLSQSMLDAVAERVRVALATVHTAQERIAAEIARTSEDLKSAVLDALAHEIKGPVATVKFSVSALLSQPDGDPDQRRELLTIIDEESDRIARWIDDAILVSRGEAGQLRLRKTPNSVKEVVARALEGLGPLAAGRPIDVRIPESLPVAAFDGELIAKVVHLLLDNAVKYSPAGSPVAVSAEFTGAEMVLSVADRGRGIPDGERERIFQKYYRGGAASGVPGMGLGLASAKCILEAHGGEIWVSGGPGSGSVFHVSLPVAVEVPGERSDNPECR